MRSRPDLKLYLTPGTVEPGARFRAEAAIVSRSKTPIDGVEFHLVGIERRHAGTSMSGNVAVPIYQEIKHVDLVARTPATTLEKGEHKVAVDFDLPPSCPPAYHSAAQPRSRVTRARGEPEGADDSAGDRPRRDRGDGARAARRSRLDRAGHDRPQPPRPPPRRRLGPRALPLSVFRTRRAAPPDHSAYIASISLSKFE